MRTMYAVIFIVFIIALMVCFLNALISRKSIGRQVALLLFGMIVPIIGNLIILVTTSKTAATVGYYIYFLGMDLMVLFLLLFTFRYCHMRWKYTGVKVAIIVTFAADIIQYIFNLFFHQAFVTEAIYVDGSIYHNFVPLAGQVYHRAVCYGIFVAVLVIFIVKLIRSTKFYSERYSVILLSMIIGGIWQSFYIFSAKPVDRSMIGFGVVGLLIFYFSLYYRPFRLMDRMLANVASEIPDALYFFDANGRCIWANNPGIELVGITNRNYEPARERLKMFFGDLDFEKEEWSLTHEIDYPDGKKYYILNRHMFFDDQKRLAGAFITVRDNTKEHKLLEQERYNATHDTLTGLYTKEYLYEKIAEKVKANPDERYIAAYLDVDNFKLVNDIFGNTFGDYVLKSIAERIKKETSEFSLSGRLVGDTFGLLIPNSRFSKNKVQEMLSELPVSDGKREHVVRLHMGVYEIPKPAPEVSVMFDRARMALNTVKEDLKTSMAYYDDEMRRNVVWSQQISGQLQAAIDSKQICPYLQPIVDPTGKVVGAEALVRWIHPDVGFLSPAKFVPVFENNGMIADMDKHMWRSACAILSGWRKKNYDMFLSINISPKDFYFMDVASELKAIVKEYEVRPSQLRIEITETVMMTDIDRRIEILKDLQKTGFIVEMDDFGSGYSSLNMLKDMPVDVIKIDMVFLKKASEDKKSQVILNSIVRLSEELGITSLTEGVETKEQFDMLNGMGCKMFQGYYFAKPMPVKDFEENCLNRSL